MKAISLPFSFDSAGSVSYTESQAKMWQDRVVLIVMTKLNEKLMRPTFGSNAGSMVFENSADAMVMIKQGITSAFAKWLPDLTLVNVSGYEDKNESALMLTVKYSYIDTQIQSVNIKTALINRSGDILLEVANG